MPTVIKFDGLRVVVYPNVIGRGCEALFNLNCPAGPVELRENYRFSYREFKRIVEALRTHLEELCQAWEHIDGIA